MKLSHIKKNLTKKKSRLGSLSKLATQFYDKEMYVRYRSILVGEYRRYLKFQTKKLLYNCSCCIIVGGQIGRGV